VSFILVYTTVPTGQNAEKIVMCLLKKKLVACAKTFPVESRYWWKSRFEKTKEYMILLETSGKNFEKIKNEIKKIHPYSVPCITKINAEANKDFEEWIREEVK